MSSSHAWLERAGWVLDITADQFVDVVEPVILSRDSAWHRSWQHKSTSRAGAGLHYYAPSSGANDDYRRLSMLADECAREYGQDRKVIDPAPRSSLEKGAMTFPAKASGSLGASPDPKE
jgi:hypothetical protein